MKLLGLGKVRKYSDLSKRYLISFYSFQDGHDFMYGGDQGRYSMETLSTTNGIKTVLVISQIIKEDAGLYSCDLSNPFGRDKHTIKIVVRGTI